MNSFDQAIAEANREYLAEKHKSEAFQDKEPIDTGYELTCWRINLEELLERRASLNTCNVLLSESDRYRAFYLNHMDNRIQDAQFMVDFYESACFNGRSVSRKESVLFLVEHHDSITQEEALESLSAHHTVLRECKVPGGWLSSTY